MARKPQECFRSTFDDTARMSGEQEQAFTFHRASGSGGSSAHVFSQCGGSGRPLQVDRPFDLRRETSVGEVEICLVAIKAKGEQKNLVEEMQN